MGQAAPDNARRRIQAMTVIEMRSLPRGLAVILTLALGLTATASAADLMETGDLGQAPAAQRDAAIRQVGIDNQALIDQRGTALRAQIAQSGATQEASILQDGTELSAVILQGGYGNVARIEQVGSGNQADILQLGVQGNARIEQHGSGLSSRIVQYGNNQNTVVRQYR